MSKAADGRFRVRRFSGCRRGVRLTVAALDGSAADAANDPEAGSRPVACRVVAALRGEFSRAARCSLFALRGIRAGLALVDEGGTAAHSGRRTAELAARRDLLAQELETRIARRAPREQGIGSPVARARSVGTRRAAARGEPRAAAERPSKPLWQRPMPGCAIGGWSSTCESALAAGRTDQSGPTTGGAGRASCPLASGIGRVGRNGKRPAVRGWLTSNRRARILERH